MTEQLQESLRKGVPDYSAILAAVSAPTPAALEAPPATTLAQLREDALALPKHTNVESQQSAASPLVVTRPQMRPRPIGQRAAPRPLGRTSA